MRARLEKDMDILLVLKLSVFIIEISVVIFHWIAMLALEQRWTFYAIIF